jgi:outer membrane protein
MHYTKKIILSAALFGAAAHAQAQSAGSLLLGTGWINVAPQVSTSPLKTTNVGGRPHDSENAGISAQVPSANTLGLTATYFITDNIAAELVTGIPPKFDIHGAGTIEGFGKVGSARMWSPTIMAKYYFGAATNKFRPFVGLGAAYIWFSDAKITNSSFENGVLGGKTNVSISKGLSPVFNLGASYEITKNWYAAASVSFIPLRRTLTLTTPSSTAARGASVTNETRAQLNPIVTYVSIGYRF